ncbi:MAG: phosphotransferase [Pirellulaceae bacterium]|nr:phosphotransferase [Pirellulaceae bacterium]
MHGTQAVLETLLHEPVDGVSVRGVGGGCISEARRIVFRQGERERVLFAKENSPEFLDNFQCESEGLLQLAAVDQIGVPQPLAVGLAEGRSWLLTEWIDESSRSNGFFDRFGRRLAAFHRASDGIEIGWQRDNYLGAAKQLNSTVKSWAEFVAECRIGYQVRWASDQGYRDARLQRDCRSIMNQMDQVLAGREDRTSLLHGDLWSGNYLCDTSGQPVIIDPAVYRGCRESEFGMLKLFGSCPIDFYDAYQDAWPMPEGWQQRSRVYVLYHLLNHLNLFGSGYLEQCRSTAADVLRA